MYIARGGGEKGNIAKTEEGDQQVYSKRQTRKEKKADIFLKGFLTGLTGKKLLGFHGRS